MSEAGRRPAGHMWGLPNQPTNHDGGWAIISFLFISFLFSYLFSPLKNLAGFDKIVFSRRVLKGIKIVPVLHMPRHGRRTCI